MATAATGRSRPTPLRRLRALPLIFTALAVVVFVFYQFVLGGLVSPVQDFFGSWLPLNQVNQCLIWATLAVGLNIVVGYAGLLDLGYAAFFAIGAYTAAFLTSPSSPLPFRTDFWVALLASWAVAAR